MGEWNILYNDDDMSTYSYINDFFLPSGFFYR